MTHSVLDAPISPLRQRLIDDMNMRRFRPPCPCCGGRMIIIEVFERRRQPRGPPDTSAANRETVQ